MHSLHLLTHAQRLLIMTIVTSTGALLIHAGVPISGAEMLDIQSIVNALMLLLAYETNHIPEEE